MKIQGAAMRCWVVGIVWVAMGAAVAPTQTIQVNRENRTIAITTSDEAAAPADTAQVSIGFETYGIDSGGTYADGSRLSNAIIEAVHALGITDKQVASVSQSLQPLNENDKTRFSKGLRFRLSQGWRVTVSAADAAKLLQAAIAAGANDSGAIQWSLADDNALEASAAQKALTHAREIADRMAKGLNAKLGPLVYASNQTPPRGPFGMTFQMDSASNGNRALKAAPLAIVPDKVSKSATVYAVFAIE